MGNCSSTGRAVGVRLEVLTDLGELASDGAEQQAITTAAMQRASSGPRGKQFDLLGFRHKEPQGGEDPQFDARVTFEMAATRVVRKQASAQLGTAEKLLCIGENSPVEKVVAAVNELGAPYAEAYYYIDELCSVDMVSAANIITARDAPADERSIAQQVKEDGIAAANRAALQSPARFSKPLDEADVLEKSESKAADVMKPAVAGKLDLCVCVCVCMCVRVCVCESKSADVKPAVAGKSKQRGRICRVCVCVYVCGGGVEVG
ncbi:hypothetical protein T492DRAFT_264057 [Pavlovales sp. CCMP2436]|nr:hypothetical protein T492DRAFT_264057 [Pavlovales sp. CCMP2436]